MKFRKIEFIGHPILGSVNFDFTNAAGKTVDTIILAGENGCGKSLLLSFLNTYSPNVSAKELGYRLRVEVELADEDVISLMKNKSFHNSMGKRFTGNIVTFNHDTSYRDDNSRALFQKADGSNDEEYAFVFTHGQNIFKTVFSDVEINFSPNEIRHTTSNNIDVASTGSERSSHNLATEIKQLIIDINALDSEELSKWVDSHKGVAPIDDIIHRRMRRFTNAFDKIFPSKRFVGIDNQNNQKTVLFEEFGKQMEISQLSSGEKQIVFRGGFLLRNLGTINGAPILIDEPELSLHPRWQLQILNFLKGLFTDENGIQSSQLIVATHSPFILHNNTRANDKVIVMQKSEKGEVKILDKPEYYNWSAASVVEEAFHVTPLLTDHKVIVFLEGETDEIYFNKTLEAYGFDSTKVSFNWIGHYSGGDKSKAENTGDKALNRAAAFFKANPMMIADKKVYLLYDCDTNKPDAQEGNLFIGAMTANDQATVYKIGVENLLELPSDFEFNKFYKTINEVDKYGAKSTIVELDKSALADYIINLPSTQLSLVLKNIKMEIEKIIQKTGV